MSLLGRSTRHRTLIVHRQECGGGWQRCALKPGQIAGLDGRQLYRSSLSKSVAKHVISMTHEIGAR